MISLKTAIEKIKAETDQKRQKELFAAASDALKLLSSQPPSSTVTPTASSAPTTVPTADDGATAPQDELTDDQIVSLWLPFKLACQPAMPPKLKETALDLVQKILSSSHVDSAKDGMSLKTIVPIGYAVGEMPGASATTLTQQGTQQQSPTTSQQQQQSYRAILMDDIVHTVSMASPLSSFSESSSSAAAESNVHLQIIKVLLTALTSPTCEVHEQSLLKSLQVCFNIYLFSKVNSTNQLTAKASLTQMCHFLFSKMESFSRDGEARSANDLPEVDSKAPTDQLSHTDPEVLFKDAQFYGGLLKRDAFLALRFLCKLSMKSDKTVTAVNGSAAPVDDELFPILIRTRALALELLLLILNNCGPVLLYQDPFISFIRQNITLAISRNGLVMQPGLFELSLSMFLILLKSFKAQLKSEIEVLFAEIYLFILDNPLSTLKQKLMVLQGLFKVVSNAQILVDLYVNYDCDLNMNGIYEGIVNSIGTVCGGQQTSTATSNAKVQNRPTMKAFGLNPDPNAAQERKLRSKSLRCLVAILVSLSEWMKEASPGSGLSAQALDFKPSSAKELPSPETTTSSDVSSSPVTGSTPVMIYKNPLKSLSMAEMPTTSPAPNLNRIKSPPNGEDQNIPLPEDYERIKAIKTHMKQGIAKFNEHPSKAITQLLEQKLLTDTASIVQFLKITEGLNKSAIGDYLGEGKEFNIAVMHAFVDSFDFSGVGFVVALRRFLQSFRLPGEAQKIDRIMEKFAARYCETNNSVFAKADVAYTLAFSIMMLNTDQHSTRIKQRMTKQDFIRNNRGINDNGDLPDELLSATFDDIHGNEIVMEEERTVKELEKMTSIGMRQRRELFKRETRQIEKKSQNLMKRGKDRHIAPFKSATHVDHARPMLELIWGAILANLSTIFEETSADDYPLDRSSEDLLKNISELPSGETNVEIIDLCLLGFILSIRISCQLHLDTERDAFIASLGKLTGLNDLSEMKAKNVTAAKTLISTCLLHANQLEDSWQFFLSCISDMDKWHLIGDGSKVVEDYKKTKATSTLTGQDSSTELKAIHLRRPSLNVLTAEFNSQQMLLTIDRIFSNSVNLDGSSIVHFFRCLCKVSQTEIESARIFMLQKVVEISHYNMQRIRLEWTQIWKILTSFFNIVGCHQNVNVATYAVDSLRQLGMKFLDRDELAHFSGHNEFFKPFEHIMRNTQFPAIRDLVVQSIHQMVSSRAQNIRSGWRVVFSILAKAASLDSHEAQLVNSSFQVLREVLHKHWDKISDFFVDYTGCLVEFALISDEQVSHFDGGDLINASLGLISESTLRLAADHTASSANVPLLLTDDEFYLKWFPILSGLSRVQRDAVSAQVRSKSLSTFFEILSKNGKLFSFEGKQWKAIIKSVILPVFEDLKMQGAQLEGEFDSDSTNGGAVYMENNQSAIWIQAVRHLIEVYTQYFVNVSSEKECFLFNTDLIKELLDLIILLAGRNSQNLAQTGIIYLNEFVKQNSPHFNDAVWDLIVDSVERVTAATIPVELFRLPTRSTASQKKNRPMTDVAVEEDARIIASIDLQHAILKCAVHLFLLEFIRDFSLEQDDPILSILRNTGKVAAVTRVNAYPSKIYRQLSAKNQARILSCLHASFSFALSFNSNYELRQALFSLKVVEKMPSLVRQEVQSISTYLAVLFHSYRFVGDQDDSAVASDEEADCQVDLLAPSNLTFKKKHLILESILSESMSVLERYVRYLGDVHRYGHDLQSWAVVVVVIFKEVLSCLSVKVGSGDGSATSGDASGQKQNCKMFKRALPQFFRMAIKLVPSDNAEVRPVLQEFMDRIAQAIDRPDFLDTL